MATFALSLPAQELSQFEKRQHVSSTGSLPFRLLLPENYDGDQKYPVVLFLHGAGERGSDNEKQLSHGVGELLKEGRRQNYPCIVVVPQCPEDSYWAAVTIDRTVNPFVLSFDYSQGPTKPLTMAVEIVQQMVSSGMADEGRLYITGLSMGGMGTLQALHRYPDLFAGAAAVCGGGDLTAFGAAHAKTPIWLFHGDADQVVSVEESRKMYQRFTELGASDVKYTEYAGVNHNSWDAAYASDELWTWLFARQRW